MKQRSTALRTDIAFLALLSLIFLGIIFVAIDADNIVRNGVILCGALIVLLLTYYTSQTTGLVLSAILAFLITAYTGFYALSTGTSIPISAFFWILWIPVMTICIASFTRQTAALQEENAALETRIEQMAMVDKNTQLKNLRAYENDATVYMKIANRYAMPLILILWQFRYPEETMRILGGEAAGVLAKRISDVMSSSLRSEDVVYLVDDNPYRWGTLVFSRADSVDVLLRRITERIADIETDDLVDADVPMEFATGFALYDNTEITPLTLINLAKLNMRMREDEAETDKA